MKHKILNFVLNLLACTLFCTSISFAIHSNYIDKQWAKANEIRIIQKENKTDYLSAYLQSEQLNPTYYNSSYFYKLQYISRYWNFDAPYSNNLFFRYKQIKDYKPLLLAEDEDEVSIDVFCNLYETPNTMFPLHLEYGYKLQEKVNRSCCEYSYISKALADKLNITADNYKNKSIPIKANRRHDNGSITEKNYTMKIAGVISNSSMGVYDAYLENKFFVFTNWSEDIQTSMNNPDFNIIFYKDEMKNRYYLSTLENAIKDKLTLIFEDKINAKTSGANNKRMNEVDNKITTMKTKNVVPSIIVSISMLLFVFVIYFFAFKKKKLSFLTFFHKNYYWLMLLGMFISLASIYYLFPFMLPNYVITLSELGTTITISIFVLAETLIFSFSDKLDSYLKKNDSSNSIK